MKQVSEEFKKKIISYGREQDAIITFGDTTITSDDLNGIYLYYEGRLLKSVMKGLNLDSNIEIPIGTEFVLKYGLNVNGEYEYINLGTFVVRNSEYQEDTYSYSIECYDRLLYSMVEYKNLNITYPISIRDYITKICEQIGLQFKNKEDVFPNYDKIIYNELYLNIDYTFRDVFDELSQVVAGVICIDEETGQVEIRNIKETGEEINEDYFNEVNVKFGEKFGPINSIVLSRADADNVYLSNNDSIAKNGLSEVKIIDNQIMNFDDRSDYLPDLLDALNGIEYYLNDFSSTGIMYLDLLDRYTVRIGDNTYSCVMFNDDISIEQGLEEIVYTERPEESKTEYEKADKTDRKINRTQFSVDKQNQKIESLVEQIGDRTNKITSITQDLESIELKVNNVVGITNELHGINELVLNECMNGNLLEFRIIGNNTVFKQLITGQFKVGPNALVSTGKARIRVIGEELDTSGDVIKTTETIHDFGVVGVLRQLGDVYDEFVLQDNKAMVIRRIAVTSEGEMFVRETPEIQELGELSIPLVRGRNRISIIGFTANMYAKWVIVNDYTSMFATTVELESAIKLAEKNIELSVTQKVTDDIADEYATKELLKSSIEVSEKEITAEVNKKVDEDEIVAKINLAVENKQGIINLVGNQVTIDSDYFTLDKTGKITASSGEIGGLTLEAIGEDWSDFYKIMEVNGERYQSGLWIPQNAPEVPFLYAGLNRSTSDGSKFDANAYITHNGVMYAKWFQVNGESGSFSIDYDNGKKALSISNEGLFYHLNNDKNAHAFVLNRNPSFGMNMIFYDYYGFLIYDGIHNSQMAYIQRYAPEHNAKDYMIINMDVHIEGNSLHDGQPTNIFIRGYEVQTTASDKRIKKNIVDSEIKAIELINKIHHKSFDWNKEKAYKEGHVDCGYIAQELIEIDPNFVIYNNEFDTYQINTLYVLSTSTKAIQELNAKIEKRDKIIEFLAEKLDCKDEVLEMLKEGE